MIGLALYSFVWDIRLHGRVDANLKIFAVYDLLTGFYTFETPVLGARFQVGDFVPPALPNEDAYFTQGD